MRVLAVLGYSDGRGDALHPVCRARLEHAARVARDDDVVVLTGWARRNRGLSEAELMARAWEGPADRVVLDARARSTRENAAHAAGVARSLAADELVVVTSGWHGRRSLALFRRVLRGSGVAVRLDATPEAGTAAARLRETVCMAGVPLARPLAA